MRWRRYGRCDVPLRPRRSRAPPLPRGTPEDGVSLGRGDALPRRGRTAEDAARGSGARCVGKRAGGAFLTSKCAWSGGVKKSVQVDGIAFSTFVIPLLFFNSAIPHFSILTHYFLLKTRSLHRESTPRLLAGISLEHVESYRYISRNFGDIRANLV